MKEYYKYRYGYINIDDHFLFLTRTGNWSETRKLEEKNHRSSFKSKFRPIRIVFYLLGLILVVLFTLIIDKEFNLWKVGSIISSSVLIDSVYNYLKRETGSAFRIPKEKILELDWEGKTLTLSFLNGSGQKETIRLNNLEVPNQNQVLEELKLNI